MPVPSTGVTVPTRTATGFDHDLLMLFARSRGLTLDVVEVDSAAALVAEVAAGSVHLGVGGLYSPPAPGKIKADAAAGDARAVLWTNGYHAVEPVLLYGTGSFQPRSWRRPATAPGSPIWPAPASKRNSPPRAPRIRSIEWVASTLPSAESLIGAVSAGSFRLRGGAVDRRRRGPQRVSWTSKRPLPSGRSVTLPGRWRRRIARCATTSTGFSRKSAATARSRAFVDRYFAPGTADPAHRRRRLPRAHPHRAAAVPPAVRGRAVGVRRRVAAACCGRLPGIAVGSLRRQRDRRSRLHADHRGDGEKARRHRPARSAPERHRRSALPGRTSARLPARIAEPDRTWLALAAFNIGPGHLEDARVLAQRQKLDPDRWSDVRSALPLLALPEHYALARNGYARGGMPVAFVDRVRAYYDILLRQERPATPRLHVDPPAGAALNPRWRVMPSRKMPHERTGAAPDHVPRCSAHCSSPARPPRRPSCSKK